MTTLNQQQAARKFMAENFQVNDLEGTVIRAIEQHFPKTILRGSDDERVAIRFLSYLLRFVSRQVKDPLAQGFVGAVYGILNLYGVAGLIAVMRRAQKIAQKTEEKETKTNGVTV